MNKQKAMDEVAEKIKKCRVCQKDKIGKAVVGEGSPDADVVFIGEAPGKLEAKTGRPFIGRSGKYLRQTIREIGLEEKDVYITSPVKYLPKKGTPTREEVEHGKKHLEKQLEIIDPKIVVLMGSVAVLGVLGEKVEVLKRHGEIIEKSGKKFLITFHPAYAIRFDRKKGLFKKDFQKLRKIIKR